MIFIVRTHGERRPDGARVVLERHTAPLAAERAELAHQVDVFCVGDQAAMQRLTSEGWDVVPLHDGWYADGKHGGIAVWGNGRYWELRDTPFHIQEHDD